MAKPRKPIPFLKDPEKRRRIGVLRELRRVFPAFRDECHRIVNLHSCHEVLFSTDYSAVERHLHRLSSRRVLVKSAGSFFTLVNWTLHQQWHLKVSRIADPSRTAGRENLSIHRLNELLED